MSYAAPAWDWQERFGRTIKQDARHCLFCGPLPFRPMALVYDLLDAKAREISEHKQSNMLTKLFLSCINNDLLSQGN